jgi:hypothetical protein
MTFSAATTEKYEPDYSQSVHRAPYALDGSGLTGDGYGPSTGVEHNYTVHDGDCGLRDQHQWTQGHVIACEGRVKDASTRPNTR